MLPNNSQHPLCFYC